MWEEEEEEEGRDCVAITAEFSGSLKKLYTYWLIMTSAPHLAT
jgi:hypothetical protein